MKWLWPGANQCRSQENLGAGAVVLVDRDVGDQLHPNDDRLEDDSDRPEQRGVVKPDQRTGQPEPDLGEKSERRRESGMSSDCKHQSASGKHGPGWSAHRTVWGGIEGRQRAVQRWEMRQTMSELAEMYHDVGPVQHLDQLHRLGRLLLELAGKGLDGLKTCIGHNIRSEGMHGYSVECTTRRDFRRETVGKYRVQRDVEVFKVKSTKAATT